MFTARDTSHIELCVVAVVCAAGVVGDDVYCFELVCMLSSLSDTDAGKARVAQPGMVGILVALLPVATPRVQRQVLLILRRVLLMVDPKLVDDKVCRCCALAFALPAVACAALSP